MRSYISQEIITDFLSSFKFTQKDLEGNFANIHLNDDDDSDGANLSSLKYMSQLVRIIHAFNASLTILDSKRSQIANNKCSS